MGLSVFKRGEDVLRSLQAGGMLLVVALLSGCSDPGAVFPIPKCKPGETCFSDDLRESGGKSAPDLGDPIPLPELSFEGNNISVIVRSSPFGLSVKDKNGNTVLSSIESDTPNYSPQCHFYEPNAVGEFLSSPDIYGHFCERYHALHFEVGEPETFQFINYGYIEPSRIYRSTTAYFVTDVIEAVEQDGGLMLTLATTRADTVISLFIEPDPTGAEAIRISASVNDASVQSISMAFKSQADESFYGFGGRRIIDQKGQALYSWTEDAMAQNSIFPKISAHRAYGPQAIFYSSSHFGFLLENSELSRFYMGNDRPDAWKMNVSSNKATFVVSAGSAKENIENLTTINGRHLRLPEWAKGFIFSHRAQISLLSKPKPGAYFASAMEYLKQLEALDIETAGYLIEAWGSEANLSQQDLRRLIAELKRLNIKPLTYLREMVTGGMLGTEDQNIYDTAIVNGYVPSTASGSPYTFSMWLTPTSVIDYTNPSAVEWWDNRVTSMLALGSEGFMLDFGEQVRPDMYFHNGETGRSMHNKLSTLAAKETSRIVDAFEQANPGTDVFYFTRSNYSGRPGSAAYEHAQFLGDNTQSWDALTGIKSVIPDVVNRGLGGAYNVTTDIAGYWDLGKGVADKELFIRWSQLATFIPLFRLHNSPFTSLKTPWYFDEQTLRIFKGVLAQRKKALPYMDTLWDAAASNGIPLWRPMWLEYPGDPRFRNESRQFMLGDRVLVAPVLDKHARKKSVVLPEGCWQYVPSKKSYAGGQTVVVDAPLDVLPYFFKCDDVPFN